MTSVSHMKQEPKAASYPIPISLLSPFSFANSLKQTNSSQVRARSNTAKPELDAWINDMATLQHWDDHMLTVGDHPQDQAELHQLVDRVWQQSREVWSNFLGKGLLGTASEGNLEGAKQLISAGANLRCRDRERRMPLHRAAQAGHADLVSYLLQADGGGNQAPSTGQGLGEPVILPFRWNSSKEGSLQLTRAPSHLQCGRDNSGSIPLHLAAAGGKARVVDLLLQNGADCNAPNGRNQRPLHLAAMCSSGTMGDTIRFLIEAGADVMARDNTGRTPLHAAASEGTEEAISVLIAAGARPQATDNIGRRTPLHDACARLRPNNVERLLDLGADERVEDNDGQTALDRIGERAAAGSVDPDVVDFIRRTLRGGQKGRTWRRRRLLMLLRSRQPAVAEENGSKGAYHQPLVAVVVSIQDDVFRCIVSYL